MMEPTSVFGHANQWYHDRLQYILDHGLRVVARGRATREVLHAVTTLPDPRKRVITVPHRRSNPFFQIVEPLWILAGRSDAAWITPYNAQLAKYLDPESGHFHGAYGERLRHWGHHTRSGRTVGPDLDQLTRMLVEIERDGGTRRAVAVLHNPLYDSPWISTLDRPCNIALSIQLREGALHMATFNRSNDYVLGLTFTNLVQFTTIQEVLASALGADVGPYTHFSSSLHVYEDEPIAQRVLGSPAPRFDVYDHVAPTRMARQSWDAWTKLFEFLVEPAFPAPGFHVDSYWGAVATMMAVWSALKRDDLEAAVVAMRAVDVADWRIAAWEYLHRWARRRLKVGLVIDALEGEPLVLRGGAGPLIYRYITHDQGESAVGG